MIGVKAESRAVRISRRNTGGINGVFDEEGGYGTRATFTVDRDGIIRHIEQGKDAIDPTGAYQACSALPG